MDLNTAEMIGQSTGKNLGEVSLAIYVIVEALKQQPNFDVAGFDALLLRVIEHPSSQDKELMRNLLNSLLEDPQDI